MIELEGDGYAKKAIIECRMPDSVENIVLEGRVSVAEQGRIPRQTAGGDLLSYGLFEIA